MTRDTKNINLNQSLRSISGVGTVVENKLMKLGINSPFALLMHLPRDYEDRSTLTSMAYAEVGKSLQFEGMVIDTEKIHNRKKMFIVHLSDATGSLVLRFFNAYHGLMKSLHTGVFVRVFGEVKQSQHGFELHHPDFQIVKPNTPLPPKGLLAIYPTTQGLTQYKLRSIIRLQLKSLQNHAVLPELISVNDLISADSTVRDLASFDFKLEHAAADNPKKHNQPLSLKDAVTQLHIPSQDAQPEQLLSHKHSAKRRIVLEELIAHQLSLLSRRQQITKLKAPRCASNSSLADRLLKSLPFCLTKAQTRVVAEIVHDMTQAHPMLRLVQGDVGSGKTLVAALAACHALDAGWQVALMAPTEILAEQHFANFTKWFAPHDIRCTLLTGSLGAKDKRDAIEHIKQYQAQLVIGTHALFQEEVAFAKLGLVIIDEQHRFGVTQRLALRDKGVRDASGASTPHTLVMTATPIPRTLAMSIYGDMDTSVIDELPAGRAPITTLTVSQTRRDEVVGRIVKNCQAGKQAYWVCPLIEDSNNLDAAAAEATYTLLSEHELVTASAVRVGLIHGKQKNEQKQTIMQAFKAGEIDLLVATTVIEVGVDVPNASLMVIENAERLGLSQLHQLRGRVGRGSEKSYCVLLYKDKLSDAGLVRLNALKNSNDGFVIAETDLTLRGPGELMGKRQAGNVGFYIADLHEDGELLDSARKIAQNMIMRPEQSKQVNALIERWLGDAAKLTQV